MKTSILRIAGFAAGVLWMSVFGAKAQEPFYDTTWGDDGRTASRTKYVMSYTGLYEQESVSKYTYKAASMMK